MVGTPLRIFARTRFAPRSLVAVALAASLVLAGCSGEEEPSDEPEAQNTASGSTLMGQWPLTGLPAEGQKPDHPVMVVKVDNTSNSEPQIGLSKADLVVEELVEGGSTRLAVFYYSEPAKTVGPVRSTRASDIGIVQPADAVLVASGGAPSTIKRLKKAGVRTVTEGGPGFFRADGRSAPYNLMMDLPKLAKTLKSPAAPESYFPWGPEEDFPKGRPAKGLEAEFSGGHTTTWRFRGGSYVNTNSHAAQGDRYQPDTVLVLRVKVGNAGYLDPAGNPVPETKFTGKGKAAIFHDGRVVRGTWVKRGLGAAVKLRTKAGELTLPPGKVWLELVPTKGGALRITK